jgi:hypothetical protein
MQAQKYKNSINCFLPTLSSASWRTKPTELTTRMQAQKYKNSLYQEPVGVKI